MEYSSRRVRASMTGLAVSAIVSLILIGCGGGSSSNSTASSSAPPGSPSSGSPPPSNTPTPAPTYSVGGTIGGLNAAGLVLINGADTVSPASGATSFAFGTQLTSTTAYSVEVKSLPPGLFCQVTNGTGTVSQAAASDVMVMCSNAWTWMSGANITNVSGV